MALGLGGAQSHVEMQFRINETEGAATRTLMGETHNVIGGLSAPFGNQSCGGFAQQLKNTARRRCYDFFMAFAAFAKCILQSSSLFAVFASLAFSSSFIAISFCSF